jgi:hypothetical protein
MTAKSRESFPSGITADGAFGLPQPCRACGGPAARLDFLTAMPNSAILAHQSLNASPPYRKHRQGGFGMTEKKKKSRQHGF